MKPLLAAAALALCCAPAAAAKPLTFPQAHRAVDRWSVAGGATSHQIERCRRNTRMRIRCTISESGWAAEDAGIPCEDCEADNVWSVVTVRKHRNGRVRVRFVDFVWE